MKMMYVKDILRTVRASYSRFLSIVGIILLGAGIFAGMFAAAPDIRDTGDKYYKQANMMDIRLLSDFGFTNDDVAAIQKTEGVESVMPSYMTDTVSDIDGKEHTFRVHGLPQGDMNENDANAINRLQLVEGAWPQNDGECVLLKPKFSITQQIKIGDTIQMKNTDGQLNDTLKTTSYKIVGFVTTPYYISFNLGTTAKGSGLLEYVMYIRNSNFLSPVYTDMYVTVKDAHTFNTFTSAYDEKVAPVEDALYQLANEREQIRYDEVVGEARQKIDDAKHTYEENRMQADQTFARTRGQLKQAEKTIAANEQTLLQRQEEYENGVQTLEQKREEFQQQTEDMQTQLQNAAEQLTQGSVQLQRYHAELQNAKQQIDAVQKQIDWLLSIGETEKAKHLQEELAPKIAAYEQGEAAYQVQKAGLDKASEELNMKQRAFEEQKAIAETSFDDTQKQLESAAQQLASGKQALQQAKLTLAQNQETFAKTEADTYAKLGSAYAQITDNEQQISQLQKPQWYVLDRHKNEGFAAFEEDVHRIESLASIFPVIFFIVAILVALTTMTRMVDEERTIIGTYKALGYRTSSIAGKYLLYSGFASIIGAVLGICIGFYVLPSVIYNAYSIIYTLPKLQIQFYGFLALIGLLASLLCTITATMFACVNTLREVPAQLMQPRAPKPGKRVLLERIRPLWRRLSFTRKITIRNLFRNKKRLLMTVIGIAGCTALLLTAFGVNDATSALVHDQFQDIFMYDTMITLNNDTVSPSLQEILNDKNTFDHYMSAMRKSMTVTAPQEKNGEQGNAYLFVPEDIQKLKDNIKLRDRATKKEVPFDENSVVITEKLAEVLHIRIGDTIQTHAVDIGNQEDISLKVTGITENYAFNYIYLSANAYRAAFLKEPSYNQVIAKTQSAVCQDKLSERLLHADGVGAVTFTDDVVSTIQDSIHSINKIIIVLIIAAGALAFIVLYNLTNINIAERIRELATIKVLGFNDREVNAYVYRETLALSLIGTLVGLLLGVFIFGYVEKTVEAEMLMFGRTLHFMSYFFAFALSLLFTVLVNLFMFFKLKKIDMIESLKSVE